MTREEIKKILLANREILKKYKVKSIALSGSYGRSAQREDSGIELLVKFEEDTYDNFIHLIFSLEEIFKKKVQVVTEVDLSPYIRPYILKEAGKN
uniref:Nucleotidyltransferase n=1 Tax=candidate division WOR-3 bacterium TaxID=2052148 RepID=A0A7C3URJ1_UNCW3